MSLTGRLTAFFLAALALILISFSVAMYMLAATYLERQANERLDTALAMLSASIEEKTGVLEWEPSERTLTLGQDSGEEQVRWTVFDGEGRLIDYSRNLSDLDFSDEHRWQSRSQTINAPHLTDSNAFLLRSDRVHRRYDKLVVTVALSPGPNQATLNNLFRALLGLGTLVWLLSAVLGWWLCRQALMPVRQMAAAARAMSAADLDHRLAPTKTGGDELEELGIAFNDLLGRLQVAFERQSRFTGDAAHQLNTPLTVLLGQLEVALRRERSMDEYRAALTEAHTQAVHLRQTVELLLFLARPEADAAPPSKEVIDLRAWLSTYLAHWDTHPRRTDLQMEIASTSPMNVEVAPAMLGQLLDNLLDNAFKYSTSHTPVRISLKTESSNVFLSVSDAGYGIAAEELPHIFEPFYRSPQARRLGKPGIGLGLAVASRLARVLGGKLNVESEPGYGSQFTLDLPITPA